MALPLTAACGWRPWLPLVAALLTSAARAETNVWYNGDRPRGVRTVSDEILIVLAQPAQHPGQVLRRVLAGAALDGSVVAGGSVAGRVRLRGVPSPADRRAALRRLREQAAVRRALPIYYPREGSGSALSLPQELLLHFQPGWSRERIDAWLKTSAFETLEHFDFAPSAVRIGVPGDVDPLVLACRLRERPGIRYAYPNWWRERARRNDPLYPDQWHLENLTAPTVDIDVASVWNVYRGTSSVVVAIVDDGVELTHEDITGGIVLTGWDFVNNDNDPNPSTSADNHGTAVAGLVGARGFNGVGVRGVAPLTGLTSHRVIGFNQSDSTEAAALSLNTNQVAIYNNSWGPDDRGQLEAPGPLVEAALIAGTSGGRGGRGCIYVWAGGNGAGSPYYDYANYDGYANSRYTIAVGAVSDQGTVSDFSEHGPNLFVVAPSSGGVNGITTTDRTGSRGYVSVNYVDDFGGTSASVPMVAGVVALMLQANPTLTWRDVQHILLKTGRKIDAADGDWQPNGGGHWVNHKYGFGLVDASNAIALAEQWVSAGAEQVVEVSASPNVPIPDNDPVGISDNILITNDLLVEYVDVIFDVPDHTYRNDLIVELTSPAGTRSLLANTPNNPDTTPYAQWRFGSTFHFEERSIGSWTLHVRDVWADDTGTLLTWTLRIYGHAPLGAPVLTSMTSDAAVTVLGWTPVARAMTYRVERATNRVAGVFEAIGTVQTNRFTDNAATESAGFYRIKSVR